MTLHDRIMALPKRTPGQHDVVVKAASMATEADELMAEMAEAITKYATARTVIGARQAQSELLKVYGKIKERNNEQ